MNTTTRLLLLTDGSVVAPFSSSAGIYLAKFTKNGRLDDTFGSAGTTALSPLNGSVTGIVADSDGRAIVSVSEENNRIILVRYTPSGVLDQTFGTNGIVKLTVPDTIRATTKLAIQADGRIDVLLVEPKTTKSDAVVARIWP